MALEEIANKGGLDAFLNSLKETVEKDIDESWAKWTSSTENISTPTATTKSGREILSKPKFIDGVETLGKDKFGTFLEYKNSSQNYESIVNEQKKEWNSRKINDVVPKRVENHVNFFIAKYFENYKILKMYDSNIVFLKGNGKKIFNDHYRGELWWDSWSDFLR